MANTLASNELRKGMVFVDGPEYWIVLDYKHIKMGRGQATIRVKVKNLYTGSITEKTFTNEQRVDEADISKSTAQYLYSDGDSIYFMDSNDFSQFSISADELGDDIKYLTEGQKVIALFLGQEAVSVEIPKTVELKVIDAPHAVAGDTAGNAYKKVTMETGLQIDAPLFVKTGDILKINTEERTYVNRV